MSDSDETSVKEVIFSLLFVGLFIFNLVSIYTVFQNDSLEDKIYYSYDNIFEREMTEYKEKYDNCINNWKTQKMIDICHVENLGLTFESELFFEEWSTWESQKEAERKSKYYSYALLSVTNFLISAIFSFILTVVEVVFISIILMIIAVIIVEIYKFLKRNIKIQVIIK